MMLMYCIFKVANKIYAFSSLTQSRKELTRLLAALKAFVDHVELNNPEFKSIP